jgi:uncharacterized membrane protein YccC
VTPLVRWVQTHDPEYGALRRAGRIAIVVPGMLAIGLETLGNPLIALFAGLGSLATLLFVEFRGPRLVRLQEQIMLAVSSGALVVLGTLVSRWTWLAATTIALVAFVVLFSGVVSSVLASAANAQLVGLIVAVSFPGGPDSIPDRLAGWEMACGASLIAITVLWPAPAHDRLRTLATEATHALAARLHADASRLRSHSTNGGISGRAKAIKHSDEAVTALHQAFLATPSRPIGMGAATQALVSLVDDLIWLSGILSLETFKDVDDAAHEPSSDVHVVAAQVLEAGASLLRGETRSSGDSLSDSLPRLQEALDADERATVLAFTQTVRDARQSPHTSGRAILSSLDPSFRARQVSFITLQIAATIETVLSAESRIAFDRVRGVQKSGRESALRVARNDVATYARRSVTLQNSVRGATVLGCAVLVAGIANVQESFWVVLGALAVLRTTALNTGQNIFRALLGTVIGSALGAALVALIGTNTNALWIILPFAVLFSGFAPSAVSFAAGQGAFTVAILVLFNIVHPAGWHSGVVRLEDVAIGCGVSLVGGLVFWPRGAGAVLGRALAEAYEAGGAYFGRAVRFGISRSSDPSLGEPVPRDASARALSAAHRLDDAFRGFLAERGSNALTLSEVTTLISGVARMRLAADSVVELWANGNGDATGDHSHARRLLAVGAKAQVDWYALLAAGLVGYGHVPDALGQDPDLGRRVADAVNRDLLASNGVAGSSAVRMLWTGDHIDSARRLQDVLVGPAREVAASAVRLSGRQSVPSSQRNEGRFLTICSPERPS